MANKFSKGDVVVLKSGGVPMAVELCPGDTAAYASRPMTEYKLVWQKGATPVQHSYPEHVLEAYTPPAKK